MLALAPLAASASDEVFEPGQRDVEVAEIVPLTVTDRGVLSELGSLGVDLGEEVHQDDDGFTVHAVVTKAQQAELREMGIRVGRAVKTEADFVTLQEEYRSMTAAIEAAEAEAEQEGDDLRVQRAQWFDDPAQGRFLEVEVYSAAGSVSAAAAINVTFDAGPGTAIGDPGTQSFNLSRFVDAGFYQSTAPTLRS